MEAKRLEEKARAEVGASTELTITAVETTEIATVLSCKAASQTIKSTWLRRCGRQSLGGLETPA